MQPPWPAALITKSDAPGSWNRLVAVLSIAVGLRRV
jgi:hypothetical protein